MYERSTRGVKYQLTGLNLWVVALVLAFGLTVFAESFFGFIIAFAIFILIAVGLVLFIIGLILILLGGKELKSISWSVGSLLLLILSPFVIMGGIFNVYPMNFIIIHIGIWMLLASLVLPYVKMGGLITGMIALLIETAMLIYTLSVMLAGTIGITMPLVMSLIGGYFLFLEFSIIISYLKLKNMQADLQVIEGKGEKRIEMGMPGKPLHRSRGNIQARRSDQLTFETTLSTTTANRQPSGFKVLEFEFSGSSRVGSSVDDKDPFKGIPTQSEATKERREREPVVGRALEFDEAVKRTEAAFRTRRTEPEAGEKYTIEDEEEIDISFEDLYIDGQTLYEILKTPRITTANDIRKAYRKRAILFHPDKNRDMGPLYAETIGLEMRKLNTAKAILLDPAKRSIYDKLLDSVS